MMFEQTLIIFLTLYITIIPHLAQMIGFPLFFFSFEYFDSFDHYAAALWYRVIRICEILHIQVLLSHTPSVQPMVNVVSITLFMITPLM